MKRLKGFKRLVAVAAASMLLCGFTCQAALGSGEETEPKPQEEHVHGYSDVIPDPCIYAIFLYQHRYVKSVTIHSSGEVEYEYAYCDVVRHYYRPVARCQCGAEKYGTTYEKDLHMSCNQ